MKSVLIFAYYSIKDPVFQSSVLQYFKKFSHDLNLNLVLLTFEHEKYQINANEIIEYEKLLAGYNIKWHRMTWHSGKLKPIKKLYDLLTSLWTVRSLIRKYNIETVYSEGFPGAIIGYLACSFFKRSHIIHTFEPHAEYMLEAGEWTAHSWEYKLLKYFYKRMALHADSILTATDGMKSNLKQWGVRPDRIHLVPSCVDTQLFQTSNKHRVYIRKKCGFTKEDKVVVYLGKFGGMYWSEEFYQAVSIFAEYQQSSFKFLIITTEKHENLNKELFKLGVDRSKYFIITLDYLQVHKYLSAADIGLVAVRQKPSKRFCSPIKTGEYLSCGLPVIIPQGISDEYEVLANLDLGISLINTSVDNLKKLPIRVEQFLNKFTYEESAKATRAYALKHRCLRNYLSVYQEIFKVSSLVR